jgi:hypothetical protein
MLKALVDGGTDADGFDSIRDVVRRAADSGN